MANCTIVLAVVQSVSNKPWQLFFMQIAVKNAVSKANCNRKAVSKAICNQNSCFCGKLQYY